MKKINVRVINESGNELPKYATEYSSGMDLRAWLPEDKPILLRGGERVLVPTGIRIELPDGYEAQVRPRSGLALKQGITVLNTPGTIDKDYTGTIGVILYSLNPSDMIFQINNGDRIAQLVIAPVVQAGWQQVDSIDDTERADGGYGHSGIK